MKKRITCAGLVLCGIIQRILLPGVIFLFAALSPAGTHYVRPPGTTTTVASPYDTWVKAATNIQQAVDAAMASLPATVWVTNGNYCVTNQVVVTNAIVIRSVSGWTNTSVYGGWPACTTRVFYITNGGVLDGFTVSNGYDITGRGGGGIYAVSNVVIRNCRIMKNIATSNQYAWGGGVYAYGHSIVTNCLVMENRQFVNWQNGAGIALGANSHALNCHVISNRGANNGNGGGISASAVDCVVTNCLIAFNHAQIGGGICSIGLVTDCVVSNNSGVYGAVFSQGNSLALIRNTAIVNNSLAGFCSTYGTVGQSPLVSNCYIAGNSSAGIHSQSGARTPFRIYNCTITGNKASGVYMIDASEGIIDSCHISNNLACSLGGGGVYARRGIIRNCVIHHNTNTYAAVRGGGVCLTNVSGATNMDFGVFNCVIADNYSTNEGGGVALFGESNLVANCIILSNRSSSGVNPDFYNTLSNSNSYWNCCANDSAAPLPPAQGNITNDPLFAGAYRPKLNSPCVNAGLNRDWMTNAVDFDCRKRVFYKAVDIGPFERVYSGTVFCFQ